MKRPHLTRGKRVLIAACAIILAAVCACALAAVFSRTRAVIAVDASSPGGTLPNIKSDVNVFGGRFAEDPARNAEDDPYEFIENVQLMECSGGSPERDLFAGPEDASVTDDYDFSPLLASCRGVLAVGAKPFLKLGNVPRKLSARTLAQYESDGGFGVNVYPPDDYRVYDAYIRALAGSLVGEFGLDEVRAWRFGVLTEYENAAWFKAPGGDPQESMRAYCELYDHTVQSLIDVLGPDVFVGAHSMTVTEGLWDERDFIRHCASGTNAVTGKTGTRLCYLSASWYALSPGRDDDRLTLPQTVAVLRDTAQDAGLTGLLYGVDEGRVLCGPHAGRDTDDLLSRTVGYTWQASFDARLAKQGFDSGLDWFSSWAYCSDGLTGVPTVSYHVARQLSRFAGAKRLPVSTHGHAYPGSETDAVAALDADGAVRLMVYNYKNDLGYKKDAEAAVTVTGLDIPDGETAVTLYEIGDGCNWFDEWQADRKALGIGDDAFLWSPDDGNHYFADDGAREAFDANREKYLACARLVPRTVVCPVKDGALTLSLTIEGGGVVFAEIAR